MSQSSQAAGSGWPIYKRLLGYVRPYRIVFTLGALAMVLHAISDAGVALQMQPLLDEGFGDGDRSAIPLVIAILAGLFFLRAISGFVASYSIGHVGRSVVRQLRAEILDRYLRLPVDFFDRSSTGVLISKLTYDAEQLAEASSRAIIIMVSDTLKVIGLVAVMFATSWKLSLVVVIVAPIIGLLINLVSGRFRRYSARIQHSMGDLTQVTEEAVVGQRVIKVFGGADYERNRFFGTNRSNFRQHMRLIATQAGSNAVVMLIAGVGIVTVVYFATSILREQLTVGSFGTFFTAMVMTNAPLKRLSDVVALLQKGIAAGQSLFDVLDLPVEPSGGGHVVDRVRGEIEFRDVAFAYDVEKGRVLNDISFSLQAGKTLAVVGQSGSGKSTLVALLPRFYNPDSGEILLDGRRLADYDLESLRKQIGFVSQDITLFNDTIARNIAYGYRENATPEQVRAAAQAAHVTEFVDALPEGFDTIVGDRGVLLSGGQRQRIAIARALLKDAPVLILDEATSALDSASERKIQEALEELKSGRTTLVIAHRLSTVENADRIMVLDAGRVVEFGTHEELYARGGHYQALHKIQFRDTRAAAL